MQVQLPARRRFSDTAQVQTVAANHVRTNMGLSLGSQEESSASEGSFEVSDTSSKTMLTASSMEFSTSSDSLNSDASITSDTGSGTGSDTGTGNSIAINAVVDENQNSVEVSIEKAWTPYFAKFLPASVTNLKVVARAQVMGTGKICVIGLMESSLFAGIHLDQSASLSAPECGVYSNSTSFASVRADANSQMTAELICAAGGYWAQDSSSFTPAPTTDCPTIPDPLSDRPAPSVGSCVAMDLAIDEDTTLTPGTYCGGISITGTSKVTLQPGVYVMKDGPLTVADEASLSGEHVGFYLTGAGSVFSFAADTSISLGAPSDGPLAGLLVMEDANVNDMRVHQIRSNDARKLLGTIYLPKSILQIAANAPVADQSAYTAIVTMRLWLQEGPTLILNSNYSATDVPVPSAITGGRVVLTK